MRLDLYYFKVFFLIPALGVVLFSRCHAQSYGLEFASHDVVLDKRTSLDLSPAKAFTFKDNFDLTFDLSFVPNRHIYFGYILRIIGQDNRNIDVIYDNGSNVRNHFNVVIGGKLSNINFDIAPKQLFSQWNRFNLKFDFDNDRLILIAGGKTYVAKNIHLQKGAYKILFGVNNYSQFETTDVPPMRLKDIEILQNKEVQYSWPLDEENGLIAHESLRQNNGAVSNPVWISSVHYNWKMAQSVIVNGTASLAFNAKKGLLYIVGLDSLYSYDVSAEEWSNVCYKNGDINLNAGQQSAFDPYNNTLYNIFPDQQFVGNYDFNDRRWNRKLAPGPVINFWHFNKIFSQKDTSLYIFGGYGQLSYKNEVMKYHINSGRWEALAVKGDFFTPRYLAGLGGNARGDTIYIIGGYGSESGSQILNPRNIYDIIRFTVKDRTFKKLAQLHVAGNDFAFANSIVIDSKTKKYYGLIFSEHKYNSSLQLISGSLDSAAYKPAGSIIPYSFHDIHSFADLYYCPVIKKFVAVTTLRLENGYTKVNVYTLLGPPYANTDQVTFAAVAGNRWFVIIAVLITMAVAIGLYFTFRKNKVVIQMPIVGPRPASQTTGTTAIDSAQPIAGKTEDLIPVNDVNKDNTFSKHKNAIFLFGDLQVFDAEGADITKYFTPLIRELFLVVALHSIKFGRGLSSETLNERLWYDKPEKSARNNRSVSITKLKLLLDRLGGYCHLSRETGNWMINIDYSQVYVDYQAYLDILRNKKQLDINGIRQLTGIVQRGNFLSNIDYEWLYPFKSEISNDVIDSLLHFLNYGNHSHDPELLIEIVNSIFFFDSVNEEAMTIKCKALSTLGKHSLARHTFENFSKEYRNLYGEEFKKDFHSVTA